MFLLFSFKLSAVLLAAAAHMTLGVIWYSPILFGKAWMTSLKINPKSISLQIEQVISAALTGFTIAVCLAHLNNTIGVSTYLSSIEYALIYWLGFIATTHFSQVTWAKHPLQAYLIDAGYWAVNLSVISCIITKLS